MVVFLEDEGKVASSALVQLCIIEYFPMTPLHLRLWNMPWVLHGVITTGGIVFTIKYVALMFEIVLSLQEACLHYYYLQEYKFFFLMFECTGIVSRNIDML